MKKQTKIAIASISAATVAATATAALLSAVKLLSDMAVKKDAPKVIKTLKGRISGGSKPDAELLDAAIEKANLLIDKCEEPITIINRDGLKLTGRWLRHPNPKRIVIAMHGWRSCWHNDFSLSAMFMYEQGCSVLFPDQRCHGQSEGEHIGFGVFERYDCADWVDYVIKNEQDELPIYLCGVSMGATTVLMASALDLPDRVKGIISDCGFTSPRDIFSHVMNKNLKIKSNLALNIASFYVNKEAKLDTGAVSTVDAVGSTNIPILFVHGDADTFVPVEMTHQNYDACSSQKEIIIVEGAEHGLSFYVDSERYKKAVCDFFEKYD